MAFLKYVVFMSLHTVVTWIKVVNHSANILTREAKLFIHSYSKKKKCLRTSFTLISNDHVPVLQPLQ